MAFTEALKFYSSLDGLAEQFMAVDKDVSLQNEQITKLIEVFSANHSRKMPGKKPVGKIPALEESLREVNNLIEQVISNFKTKTLESQRQQKLRDEFSNSFIVFIYGKVKAGKSSLGNYIANSCNNTCSYFKFDNAGNTSESGKLEELSEGAFEVKDTEATTTIQGFKLNGMTWIDSPGLHSLSECNGKLAESYVDAADLVIYTMSSDSPGRSGDMEEMIRLACDKKKKVVVLITKFDTTDSDEINGEIIEIRIPKSDEIRKEQVQWVTSELINKLGDGYRNILSDVFCISKAIAEDAETKNDMNLWEESNLPKFYDLMSDTILNDALFIKKDVPRQRLIAFVDSVIGEKSGRNDSEGLPPTVNALIVRLAEQNESVRKAITSLNEKGDSLKDWLESRIDPAIEEIFRDSSINDGQAKSKIIEESIRSLISDGVMKHIAPLLSGFNCDLVGRLSIGLNPEEIKVSDTFRNIPIKISHSGKGSTFGSILGGVIGFIVGGPIGSAIGATIGGVGGGVAGDAMSSTETERVCVGDNSFEVLQNLKKKCARLARQGVEDMLIEIRENYFRPIEVQTASVHATVVALKADLEKVVHY